MNEGMTAATAARQAAVAAAGMTSVAAAAASVVRRRGGRPRIKPPIQDIFRRGDEVLVQVIKEGIGTKGPTLSHLHQHPGPLPGADARPGPRRRLAQDRGRRGTAARCATSCCELNPPKGARLHRPHRRHRPHQEGAVARPGLPAAAVEGDRPPHQEERRRRSDIYEESDMIIRTIRDIFTGDVDAIYIDEPEAFERAKEFLQIVMPRYVNRLQLYEGTRAAVPQVQARTTRSPRSTSATCRCGAAARSSSTRPRPWSRSTSTAATSAPTTSPRRSAYPAEPARRQGDRPAAAAARPGRRDRQRLHRHAQASGTAAASSARCATP